jgi:hypothetical protein
MLVAMKNMADVNNIKRPSIHPGGFHSFHRDLYNGIRRHEKKWGLYHGIGINENKYIHTDLKSSDNHEIL